MTALLVIAATVIVAVASIAAVTKRRADNLAVEVQRELAELRQRRTDYFGGSYVDIIYVHPSEVIARAPAAE